MAEEIQIQTPPGPNGVNLKVGTKQLGITGPIVIPVLCIALVAGIGWIRSGDFKESFNRLEAQQQILQTLVLAQVDQLRLQLRAQTELINAEGKELRAGLQENRELTSLRMQKQDEKLDHQTDEVREHHAIIIYNQHQPPEKHLTLDLSIPKEPSK
jgi:hypothetical protein